MVFQICQSCMLIMQFIALGHTIAVDRRVAIRFFAEAVMKVGLRAGV